VTFPLTQGGWLDGLDRGADERPGKPSRVFPWPSVVFVLSLLCPPILFSNNHPLSSFYTSYVDKVGFIRASFISFLFLHHRLGRRSSPAVPHHRASPLNPLPEFSDHPETPQLPLTGILTVSGLQRKSDKRYNRVCLFIATPSLDLLSGRSFDPTCCALVTFGQLYTTEQFFVSLSSLQ
jgi:hypothetical protein